MNYRMPFLLLLTVITGALSCKNKDIAPTAGATTRLNVTNTSADTIKFFINGTRQNNTSSLNAGGSTGYLTVLAGTQNYKFSKATGGSPVLFTTQFTLDTSTYYSIFFAGESADKAFKIVDPLAIADTLLSHGITDTSSVIRFVNASFGAGSLDVTVGTGDTVNIKSIPFGTATPYMLFTKGSKTISIFPTGSTTAVFDTTITFLSGNIYTLFSKGQLNGTGTAKFSIGLSN